jgi:hypothetical protein
VHDRIVEIRRFDESLYEAEANVSALEVRELVKQDGPQLLSFQS